MFSKTYHGHEFSIGWLIAFLVLLIAIIFAITGHELSRDWLLGGFAALALAILL